MGQTILLVCAFVMFMVGAYLAPAMADRVPRIGMACLTLAIVWAHGPLRTR